MRVLQRGTSLEFDWLQVLVEAPYWSVLRCRVSLFLCGSFVALFLHGLEQGISGRLFEFLVFVFWGVLWFTLSPLGW